jgi:hypothetical protein
MRFEWLRTPVYELHEELFIRIRHPSIGFMSSQASYFLTSNPWNILNEEIGGEFMTKKSFSQEWMEGEKHSSYRMNFNNK